MKSANIFFDKSYGYTRSIVTLIGGLVLIIWPGVVQKWIVVILGVVILAIGIASIIMSRSGKWTKDEKFPLLTINSIFDIAFGLVLLIFPAFFAGLIMFVFGLLLLVFGLEKVISLTKLGKSIPVPTALYIGPAITTIIGIIMFFFPNKSGNWLFILFGATLLLYAISEFATTYILRKEIISGAVNANSGKNSEDGIVEDVEAEEIE